MRRDWIKGFFTISLGVCAECTANLQRNEGFAMLDVHPPHEKIHGYKDFFLHLLTITIGLLIALALEGCVERWHHRELRREADVNLQQELRDNDRDLAAARGAINGEKKDLISFLNLLEARSNNKPSDIHSFSLNLVTSTLSDASWRTATATGSLSYMEYRRVQEFASAYQQQEVLTRLEGETLDNYLQLQSYVAYGFDPSKMSPEEAKTALADVRLTLTHLVAIDQVGASVQQVYARVLAGK